MTRTGDVPIVERLGFRVASECPDEHCISVAGEPLVEAHMVREITPAALPPP